jgi:hypothetical protein
MSKAEQIDVTRDYTLQELSDVSGLHTSTLRHYLSEPGQPILKGTKRAGSWFIKGAEVKRWLERREQGHL